MTQTTPNALPPELSAVLLQSSAQHLPARRADTIVAHFEQIALSHGGNTAVIFGDQQITYAQLNERANQIAHQLLDLNAPINSIVAVWVDRSIEAITAILGVLKAGHAYLPLEPTYPAARIAQTIDDAKPAVLISQKTLAPNLTQLACPIILVDNPANTPDHNPQVDVSASDLAYVMYTSGSTGKPKGVLVAHSNVVAFIDNCRGRFHLDDRDTWTWFHSWAFDFSVQEIFSPLLTGARLVVVPFETTRTPDEFYNLLAEKRVTVLGQTPSAFALLNHVEEAGELRPLALRLVILGGEALNFATLRSWFARHDDTAPQLVNGYGPTEATVGTTFRDITEHDAHHETESLIGDPLPGVSVYLFDEFIHLVPQGETGEICIGGPGVSQGYLNRPDLTAERFIPDPMTPGAYLYRTGDLARRRADGELAYLGRRDGQIKINGFRVELGEIESALAIFPGIAQSCVAPYTDEAGRTFLAAYFVPDGITPVAVPRLALSLARSLPAQMIPAFYTRITSIPLSPNGKIDRKALPAPSRQDSFDDSETRQPSSELEEAVLNLVRKTVGNNAIRLEDNFFSVGGHSLLGTQFVLRAREAFGVKITLRDVFEAETVADLAAQIESLILEEIHLLSEDEALRLATEQAA